ADEPGRVLRPEPRVPDPLGVDDRVRPVEARPQAPARRRAHLDRPARDQQGLHGRQEPLPAARSARRLTARPRAGANEQMASRHGANVVGPGRDVDASDLFARWRLSAPVDSITSSAGPQGSGQEHAPGSMTPQHHIIKETSETLSRLLQDEFKRNGYKRVHIVEQAPKPRTEE